MLTSSLPPGVVGDSTLPRPGAGRQTGFHGSPRAAGARAMDVSDPYRDHWFWIDDRDLAPKCNFALLMLLFALADTGEKKGVPLLTIPTQ